MLISFGVIRINALSNTSSPGADMPRAAAPKRVRNMGPNLLPEPLRLRIIPLSNKNIPVELLLILPHLPYHPGSSLRPYPP